MAIFIIIISFLTSLLIRVYFISIGKHVGDVNLFYWAGQAFIHGQNPYLVYDYWVYPPLAIFLIALSTFLTGVVHLPFHMAIKIWPNLVDFLSAFLLYTYFIKTKVKSTIAALWIALFILNPISIFISSAHGQLDSVYSLFILVSIILLTNGQKIYFYLSGLILGIAIAIKPNPVMLVPFFIFFGKHNFKERIHYLFLNFAPLIISIIPFLLQDPLKVIYKLISYSGLYDMGLAAVFRGLWYQINASIDIPLGSSLLSINKLVFMLAYVVIILIFLGYKKISKTIVITYLLFLTLYFGISVQYLVLLIPFAILERDKMIIPYIFFGTLAQLGFYLFLAQDILLGNLSTEASFQIKNIYLYFYGNLLFWIFCLFWLVKILTSDGKIQISKFNPIRRWSIYIFSVAFLISLYPLSKLIIEVAKLFWSNL